MLAALFPATESDLINFQFAVYSSPLLFSPLHPYLSSLFLLSSQSVFFIRYSVYVSLPFFSALPLSFFSTTSFCFCLCFLFFHAPKLRRSWLFFQQFLFLFLPITSFYFHLLFSFSPPCFLSSYLVFSPLQSCLFPFQHFPFLSEYLLSFLFLSFPFP